MFLHCCEHSFTSNLLIRFLLTGGWGILNKWLVEFTRSQNYPVLLELIDVG